MQWGWEAPGCHDNAPGLNKLLWGLETPDLKLVCPEGKPPREKGQESLGGGGVGLSCQIPTPSLRSYKDREVRERSGGGGEGGAGAFFLPSLFKNWNPGPPMRVPPLGHKEVRNLSVRLFWEEGVAGQKEALRHEIPSSHASWLPRQPPRFPPSSYHVPGTVPNALHVLSYLIVPTTQWDRYHWLPCLTGS